MLRLIKRHLANLRRVALSVESADVVVAREALLKKENQADPSRLGRFEYQVYSQNGEDGIISEIFNRIGETNRKCVEIGVAHNENNTLHLLNQGWSGLWLDLELDKGDFAPALMDMVREGRLKAESVWVETETLKEFLEERGFGEGIDLVSVDIDYNTYAAWEAIIGLKARVAVVEYNADLGSDRSLRVAPDDRGVWDGSFYFGASLKALENLGRKHGYSLVGCDLVGVNAFFVRNDCVEGHFAEPFTSEFHYQSLRMWLRPHRGYRQGFGKFLTDS